MFNLFGNRNGQCIRQSSQAECGLACLAMVTSCHGFDTDLVTLRQRFHLTLRGSTLEDLVQMASELEFSSRAIRCEPEELWALRLPAILHWDLNHFVVLTSVSNHKFEVLDPAQGQRSIPLESIGEHFTGIALELAPNKDFKCGSEINKLRFSALMSWDKSIAKPILQGVVLSVFLQAFVLTSPVFIQLVIDQAIFRGDAGLLWALGIGFLCLKMFEIVTGFMRRVLFQLISLTLSFDLKASIFHHLIRLPLGYFHGRSRGDVQQRFHSLSVISNFVVDGLIEAFVDGLFAVLIAIVLFAYDWRLASLVLGFLLVYACFRLVMLPVSHRLQTEQQIIQADEATKFLETISAIQTIKLSGIELERENGWRNTATRTVNADIKAGNVQIAYDTVSQGMIALSHVAIILSAGLAVVAGDMSIGMLTAFLAYKMEFENRSLNLLNKWADLKLLRVHLDRVSDIALTEQDDLIGGQQTGRVLMGQVRLNSVDFRYGSFEPSVLKDVSITIEPGEFVAISGPSGHGKSTLLNLILGVYEPTSGTIEFDGLSPHNWGIRHLRQQIGTVLQEDGLLTGTVAENISLFASKPDQKRIEEAAELAAIDDVIKQMPMGYQSLIGELGSTLSGGQKQRIMIARALYRKPKILILDEGTSQLDVVVEAKINDALKALNITRIAAAHRPDTLSKADRVLHVYNGRVFESCNNGDPELQIFEISE